MTFWLLKIYKTKFQQRSLTQDKNSASYKPKTNPLTQLDCHLCFVLVVTVRHKLEKHLKFFSRQQTLILNTK